jgi:RNA polymerase primary sigma factor
MSADSNEDVKRSLSMLGQEVERLLSVLTAEEATIIKLRYGLGGDEEKSVEEVSIELGRSVAEIVQLEQSATEKLRDPAS